ncbi:MAG: amidophosphoribosyltransferase [Polyangiaceae bacterium]
MCGVFGIYGHPEAANLSYLGLHALQHRGQESAGIVSVGPDGMHAQRKMGLVQSGFTTSVLDQLPGTMAIGHVRYSTAGTSNLRNAQPFAVDYQHGSLAVAHNGNLTNHHALRTQLELRGSIFQTGSDTEVILHLIAIGAQPKIEDRIVEALRQVEGAYSVVLMDKERLFAARDPRGFRPLCIGILPSDDSEDSQPAYVVSSEPSSFELIGAKLLRDVEPGEVVIIDERGISSLKPFAPVERKMCLFEYVYFARPDAVLDGSEVYRARKISGARLIEEHPVAGATAEDTVVVPVPDSGLPAAVGLANHAGLPFEMGLIRSHYVGRTFIEPQQSIRHFGVKLKLNPNAAALRGKRVIVVDDSIVRGTTSRKLVGMLRGAGAKEVHVRISSPPTAWPCYYGIDTPNRSELIAASHDVAEIAAYLRADSLGYLSVTGLIESVRLGRLETGSLPDWTAGGFCQACFSGEYPVQVPDPGQVVPLRLING